jgi:hypothetical protein
MKRMTIVLGGMGLGENILLNFWKKLLMSGTDHLYLNPQPSSLIFVSLINN